MEVRVKMPPDIAGALPWFTPGISVADAHFMLSQLASAQPETRRDKTARDFQTTRAAGTTGRVPQQPVGAWPQKWDKEQAHSSLVSLQIMKICCL